MQCVWWGLGGDGAAREDGGGSGMGLWGCHRLDCLGRVEGVGWLDLREKSG